MKASMLIALIALSTSVYAIPPVPPSPVATEPVVIKCVDFNSMNSEELAELEEDTSRIISLDQETREICIRVTN